MSYQLVACCDMCLANGITRFAVATYWNDDGDEYGACAKHLPFVKEAGLTFKMLDNLEDEDVPIDN